MSGEPVLLLGDCLDRLAGLDPDSVDAIVQDPPAGIGFMGRDWDDKRGYEPPTERGREVMSGSRALGLEPWAAGFLAFMTEVAVAELRVVKPGAHSLSWALPRTADLTTLALRLAGWEIRDSLVHLFGGGFPKSHDVSKAVDKAAGVEREVVGTRAYADGRGRRAHESIGYGGCDPETDKRHITAPATDDAKRWDGWGTALGPGHEQWILARKPLDGTVAANVLAHGTGAINVDACRTASAEPNPGEHLGRWPKNALLSCALACEGDQHSPGCPVSELGRQSGRLQSGRLEPHHVMRASENLAMGGPNQERHPRQSSPGDSGTASRYFPRFGYHPKAHDRTVPGRVDLENKHPTHKHPDLMRWLVRLVTPPGGLVLDAFMGSGTTGVATVAEGARFLGIERDPVHFEVARARILAAVGSPEYAAEANASAPPGAQLGLL